MKSDWRERARPIIAQVLKENLGADEKTIRKALKDAYPFHMRQYHPYKIWLDEIARQRGKKRNHFGRRKPAPVKDPDQMEMF